MKTKLGMYIPFPEVHILVSHGQTLVLQHTQECPKALSLIRKHEVWKKKEKNFPFSLVNNIHRIKKE